MNTAIKFQNVSFIYENSKTKALKSIDFEIESGQFVAIVGSNGSGKSTLAKLTDGLFVPTEGDVKVFDMDTKDDKTIFDIRKNVGMVFQNPDNQMIATIVEDDIAFGPENLGVPREEIKERIDWALESVGMSDFKRATPFKLSGGQKQRIAIAGVLALKPKIMVLDEATAMLDPGGRREVMNVVSDLNKEGMTVIHITHYMEETLNADRIIVMDGGRIVMDGAPKEIFARYKELDAYGLALPTVASIADILIEKGMNIERVMTRDALVEELCRLM